MLIQNSSALLEYEQRSSPYCPTGRRSSNSTLWVSIGREGEGGGRGREKERGMEGGRRELKLSTQVGVGRWSEKETHLSSTAVEIERNKIPPVRIDNWFSRSVLRMNNPKKKIATMTEVSIIATCTLPQAQSALSTNSHKMRKVDYTRYPC